jgi:hypothetical protein
MPSPVQDADASQNALRIRRRIPPLPRLGRHVDDLLMAKQRRRRSTTGLHASDDIRPSSLSRIGRFVGAFDAASRLDGDDDASEFGYEYDYGTRSSLLPRIGLRTAVVRAAPLPRMGRRNSDDELGVVPFPRLGE